MLIVAKGKNLDLTPSLHALVQRKLTRLARYVPEVTSAEIECSVETAKSVVDRHIVQVTLDVAGRLFRAEQRAGIMEAALDAAVDQLQNQLKDYRARERARIRGRTPAERVVVALAGPTGGDYSPVIPPSPVEPPLRRARRHPGAG